MPLEKIIKSTGDSPKLVVIWLHGLGADGNDFAPVVPEFNINGLPLKFVFPHAKKIPVTINGGMTMRAWYDIKSMDINQRADLTGVLNSEKLIHQLIDEQVELGFTTEQIILAGFSQGGAMTLHTGLRYKHKLAGLIALSCYIPSSEQLPLNEISINKNTPVFLGHGTFDPVVPFNLGQAAKSSLEASGYNIDWNEYPLQHGVNMEEINDVRQWIIRHQKT